MNWITEYRGEFTDIHGVYSKVDIESEDYAGNIKKLLFSGAPLLFEFLTNSDNLFGSPVKGTKVDFTIWSDTDFEYAVLYSVDDFKYRVKAYYADDILYFTGYIISHNYSEPYDGVSYAVTVSASCGLGQLKSIEYKNEGEYYNGRIRESEIILDILGKIGITSFFEFCNIYEDRMADSINDSPFDQTFIDVDIFKDMYCYEVLVELLKKFNAIIRQSYGAFYITRPTEMIGDSVAGRYFTSATTKNSVTIVPDQFIHRIVTHPSSTINQVNNGVLMIQSPAKKVIVRQDYGYKESWIDNWELKGNTYNVNTGRWDYWTNDGTTPVSNWVKTETDGVAIPASATPREYSLTQTFGTNAIISATDKFGFQFDYMTYNWSGSSLERTVSIGVKDISNSKWLHDIVATAGGDTMEWVDSENFVSIPMTVPVGISEWNTFSGVVSGLEANGLYEITLYNSVNPGGITFVTIFKNIKFFVNNEAMSAIEGWQVLPYQKDRFLGIFYSKMRQRAFYIPSKIRNTKRKDYIKENAINGEEVEYDCLLGDVKDANIDNVLEQFAGALAIGTGGTLSGSASVFVANHAANYLPDVILTYDNIILIFTSALKGLDFNGNTIITNTSGDLTGIPETVQANVNGQIQIDNITLTGTEGTANITCNELTRLATFSYSLEQTAYNFHELWHADFEAVQVYLSFDGFKLQFMELSSEGGFSCFTDISNISGDLSGSVENEAEPEEGTARIDIITLSGTNGTANITCDGVTREISMAELGLSPSRSWSTRTGSEIKELLQIMCNERADQYSRPKQLIQMPIMDTAGQMAINLLGNIQDTKNTLNGKARTFVINRGEFDVRNRMWNLDLFEIGTKTIGEEEPGEGPYTADNMVVTVDSTVITVDSL